MRKRLDGGVYTLSDGSSSASSCCLALRLPGTHGNDSSPTLVSQGASPLDLVASFVADVRRIYENGAMYVIRQRQNVPVRFLKLRKIYVYLCALTPPHASRSLPWSFFQRQVQPPV